MNSEKNSELKQYLNMDKKQDTQIDVFRQKFADKNTNLKFDFNKLDTYGQGFLTFNQFASCVSNYVQQRELQQLYNMFCSQGEDKLYYREFIRYVMPY